MMKQLDPVTGSRTPGTRSRVLVNGIRVSGFQLCGYTGLLLAFVQSMMLARYQGLSQITVLGATGVAILAFFVLVMGTKLIVGRELIIYYHHEIAVLAATALFLRVTSQPVLPYLDIIVLGLGIFLACGRIGCLLVGCCHGRPCDWGVVYGEEHVQAGFPAYLAGVRLFPIQAIESGFALCLVLFGMAALIRSYSGGTAFELYVLLYAVGRFCFEFARGDCARPYFHGFSEAQWTSLVLVSGEISLEYTGLLPHYSWHGVIPLVLLTAMLIVNSRMRLHTMSRFNVLHPRHVRELAEALQIANGTLPPFSCRPATRSLRNPGVIHVVETSLGLRLSSGSLRDGTAALAHYTLSDAEATMTPRSAHLLATTICRLYHRGGSFELWPAQSGVFHVMIVTS